MQRRYKTTAALAGVLLLSACASQDPVYRAFYEESGSIADNGNFGQSTQNNIAYMTGEKQYTYELASRFAAEVLTTVNFEFNSAVLDAGAQDTLREQARWIQQFPEVRFRVYGHTDAVGSDSYNKSLGLRRANAVVNYLIRLGVSRSRLEAMVSYGETQPLIVTEGRERRNRRTVTEVLGFVGSHPTVLDGKYAQIVYRDYIASGVSQTTLTGIEGRDFETEK